MGSTLAQLETRARYRSDMTGSTFVTSTEFGVYINEGYRELWNLVRMASGDHFALSTSVTITSSATNYASLSAVTAFGRLRAVEYVNGTRPDDCEPLRPFNWEERTQQSERRYRLMGNVLYVEPATLSPGTYTVWYEPKCTALVNTPAATTVDPRVEEWEEFIVLSAAIRALQKEESDASGLIAERNGMAMEIQNLAASRDIGRPAKIIDAYPTYGFLPDRLPRP